MCNDTFPYSVDGVLHVMNSVRSRADLIIWDRLYEAVLELRLCRLVDVGQIGFHPRGQFAVIRQAKEVCRLPTVPQ